MNDTPAPNQEHQHAHQHHAATEHMAPPPAAHEAMQPHTVAAHEASGDYPSAPFPTAKSGILAMWQNGGHAVWGLVVVQILITILLAVAAIVAVLGALIAILSAMASGSGDQSQVANMIMSSVAAQIPDSGQAITALSQASSTIGVIAVIALVIAFALGVYLQSTVLAFTGLTVTERQRVSFGQVMKLAFKRIGALFVQGLLLGLAVIVAFGLPLLLIGASPSSGTYLLIGLFYAAVGIFAVYAGIRLVFAPLATVALNMGPIQAIKYSWEISKKRLMEIFGAVSIVTIVNGVVSIIFTYLHASLTNATGASLIVSLLEIAAYLLINIVSFAVVAERLNQFRAVGANQATHKFSKGANWLPIAGAIVISIIGSGIENSINPASNLNPYETTPGSSLYPSTNPDSQNLQDELNKYYQDSQNLQDDSMYDYTDPSSPYYDPYYDPNTPVDDGSSLR